LRIALTDDLGFFVIEDEVRDRLDETAAVLERAGARVERVSLGWDRSIADGWVQHWHVYLAAFFGEELDKFGVDAVRLTMAFAGPPEDDIDWKDVSVTGSHKFLARAWRVAQDVTSAVGVDASTGSASLRRFTHKFLTDVGTLVESYKFNVVVARLMDLVNHVRKEIDSGAGPADPAVREAAEVVALGLSMFSPHVAEDMWSLLGHEPFIGVQQFPQADPSLVVDSTVTAVVQINGKVKERLDVAPDISESDLSARALESVAALLEGKAIRTTIVRPPKLVNIVTSD
jgi:leucyl-tRNA synthetase